MGRDTIRVTKSRQRERIDGGDANDGAARRFNFFGALGVPAVAFMVVVVVIPIGMILVQSMTNPGPVNYATASESGIFRRSVWATLKMSFIVTVLCIVIGYPYAYVLARSTPRLRSILLIALMFSFWTSLMVRTYAWQLILNDTGAVNTFLIDVGLIDEPVHMIRTSFAVYLGMTHVLLPFAILPLYAQLKTIKPEVEQAAQSLGARQSKVFFSITLPLTLPGAIGAGVLVFVLALGFYITPQVLGGARNSYIGTVIVQRIQILLDTGVGSAMAAITLAIVLTILIVTSRLVDIRTMLGIKQGNR